MSRRLVQFAVALWAAASLIVAPAFGQAQQIVAQQTQEQQAPPKPTTAPPAPQTMNLFTGQPNYTKGNSWFPNIIKPYESMSVPAANLANSPKVSDLISNGKLMLSLQDAISLAIENNLNIAVARYTPLEGQTGILGANGVFDPVLGLTGDVSTSSTLYNNTFAGQGVFTAKGHATAADVTYSELFHTGTTLSVAWDNTRQSSNQTNIFNPSVQSYLSATISQPLLRNFGIFANTYQIIEAKNMSKVDQDGFEQQVIVSVTTTALDYWALVGDLENVKVQQAAVASNQEFYDDTNKEFQIGTAAEAAVVQAQSSLANAKQAMVQAQTAQLQQEVVLLNDITKDPLAGPLAGIEIVPTTPLSEPPEVENIPIQQAVEEAWKNSPALAEDELLLENAGILAKATKNQLLPSLTLSGTYSGSGLAGNTATGGVVIDNGLGTALSDIFQNDSPTYSASLTFSMPIRNRAAQASHANALLTQRAQQTGYQQAKNTIFVNVNSAMVALKQDRASLAAAEEAVKYQQITYDNTKKTYELGTGTALEVVQQEQALAQYQGLELSAKVNLAAAEWTFNQAMSRTLAVNHIIIAGAASPSRTNGPGQPTQNAGGSPASSSPASGSSGVR